MLTKFIIETDTQQELAVRRHNVNDHACKCYYCSSTATSTSI